MNNNTASAQAAIDTPNGCFYRSPIYIAAGAGKFSEVSYDPTAKVSAAIALGRDDTVAIWFWQVIDKEIRFFEYFEQSGLNTLEICDMLTLKSYSYEKIWLPLEAKLRTFGAKLSIQDTFLTERLPARIAPSLEGDLFKCGIDAVRKFLRNWSFVMDICACSKGIEALQNYSRKPYGAGPYYKSEPDNNQWSHGADAFRYAVLTMTDDKTSALDCWKKAYENYCDVFSLQKALLTLVAQNELAFQTPDELKQTETNDVRDKSANDLYSALEALVKAEYKLSYVELVEARLYKNSRIGEEKGAITCGYDRKPLHIDYVTNPD